MRNLYLLIISFLLAVYPLTAQRVVENPIYKTRNASILTVTKIELNKKETRLHVLCQFPPGWWIKIGSEMYLQDVTSGERFFPTAIEGTEFGKETYLPASGDTTFVMIYPALKAGVKALDWRHRDPEGWATYGIELEKRKIKNALPEALTGNWLKTDGSNEWCYGFYDSLAIMDNTYWKYESIKNKGKRTFLTLKNGDDIRSLILEQQRDSSYMIGTDKKDNPVFSKTKTINPNYKIEHDSDFNTGFFERDTAHLNGYFKGYDPRLGFITGLIYISNNLTREQYPIVVPISPDGVFQADIPLVYPASLSVSFEKNSASFYIEPGQSLTLYLDWEDFLYADWTRDWYYRFPGTRFMGSLAIVNDGLRAPELQPRAYNTLIKGVDELAPNDFKASELQTQQTNLAYLTAFFARVPIPVKAQKILVNNELLTTATRCLDYMDMRESYSEQDTNNLVMKIPATLDYYDFFKGIPLNDPCITATSEFKVFINRFEYMQPFDRWYSMVPKSPQTSTESGYNQWLATDTILRDSLGLSRSICFDIAKVRSYGSTFDNSEREEALSYVIKMNKGITDPFLKEEGLRFFERTFPADKRAAYVLPEGKATEIFRRIVDPLKGKYVLVDFWATSCGPCCWGIEHLRSVREQYKGSADFTFAYVTDERSSPMDDYTKFIEKNGLNENLHRLPYDDYNYLRQLFKFNGIPRYVLVDREGNIVNDNFFALNIEYELSKIFGGK